VAPHRLDVISWIPLKGVPGCASVNGRNSTGVVVMPQGQGVIPRRPRGGASCKGLIS